MPAANAFHQLAGIILLFLVKIALVTSAEISKHIFSDLNIRRPFLVAYVRYCMLVVFLIRHAWGTTSTTTSTSAGTSKWTMAMRFAGDDTNYAKLENTASDEEYEVESLTAAEFESLASDVESEDFDKPKLDDDFDETQQNTNSGNSNNNNNDNIADNKKEDRDVMTETLLHGGDGRPLSAKTRRVRFALFREVRSFPERIQRDAKLARLAYRSKMPHWSCCCADARHVTAPLCSASNDETFRCIFYVAPLNFLSTFVFNLALTWTSVTSANISFVSYAVFSLLLGVFVGLRVPSSSSSNHHRFTLLKLGVVLVNVLGVLLLAYGGGAGGGTTGNDAPSAGAAAAVTSALAFAGYLSVFDSLTTKYVGMDANFVLGMMGVFAMVICTPVIALLHLYGGESQTPWPNTFEWALVALSGVIGGPLAELLWLQAVTLVNEPIAIVSNVLLVPLGMIADALWREQLPNAIQLLSSILITISFFGAAPFVSFYVLPSITQSFFGGDKRFASANNRDDEEDDLGVMPRRSRSVTSFCDRCFGLRLYGVKEVDDDANDLIYRSSTTSAIRNKNTSPVDESTRCLQDGSVCVMMGAHRACGGRVAFDNRWRDASSFRNNVDAGTTISMAAMEESVQLMDSMNEDL